MGARTALRFVANLGLFLACCVGVAFVEALVQAAVARVQGVTDIVQTFVGAVLWGGLVLAYVGVPVAIVVLVLVARLLGRVRLPRRTAAVLLTTLVGLATWLALYWVMNEYMQDADLGTYVLLVLFVAPVWVAFGLLVRLPPAAGAAGTLV